MAIKQQDALGWNDLPEGHADATKYLLEYEEVEPVVPGGLSDGLVAYWPFDGDAKDASGNGNDGMVNGATLTEDRNGKANGAYYFDGNDIIEVADNALLRSVTNAFSIATWLKYDQPDGEWISILSKGSSSRQFGLSLNLLTGEPAFIGWGKEAIFETLPPQGRWAHVAVTFDEQGIATAYVNGKPVGTKENTPNQTINSESLIIGSDPHGVNEHLYGSLDDLAIWKRALTEEEVARLYEGEKPVATYLVVDMSGGPEAESWPVEYLNGEPAGGFNTDEYKTTKLVLRRIEPGTFMMCGSYETTLTEPYYMGVFEVTQKQWELVKGSNPAMKKGDMRPVELVDFYMIRGSSTGAEWPESNAVDGGSFLGELRAKTGLEFDLPTEAQWEYACRAGTTSDYNNGDNSTNNLNQLGRFWDNRSDGKGGYIDAHTTVGSYLPNAWGFYDMHGNVGEWCLDWYGGLTSGVTDPKGPSSGWCGRVVRGGSWGNYARTCTSSYRNYGDLEYADFDFIGLRLACPCAW